MQMKQGSPDLVYGLTLNIVDPVHPYWPEVTKRLSRRYRAAFQADLKAFMPAYLTLTEGDQILAVCGFRRAADEPLFLEQYLNGTAETLLSEVFKTNIQRSSLVEFGHLASFTKGMSLLHFHLIAETLVDLGHTWCIFTATDLLHAMMVRLGLQPEFIALADPDRVPDAGATWGTYYANFQPRVVGGSLTEGLERLRLIQQLHRKRA
jgi:hypothetical protein